MHINFTREHLKNYCLPIFHARYSSFYNVFGRSQYVTMLGVNSGVYGWNYSAYLVHVPALQEDNTYLIHKFIVIEGYRNTFGIMDDSIDILLSSINRPIKDDAEERKVLLDMFGKIFDIWKNMDFHN